MLACFMASTSVTVLPVPGGPKIRYGAGLDLPDIMCCTAVFCSGLVSRSRLNILYSATVQPSLHEDVIMEQTAKFVLCYDMEYTQKSLQNVCVLVLEHLGCFNAVWLTLLSVGNSTGPSLCCTASSMARCWSLRGKRLMLNSTSNFILVTKFCTSLSAQRE